MITAHCEAKKGDTENCLMQLDKMATAKKGGEYYSPDIVKCDGLDIVDMRADPCAYQVLDANVRPLNSFTSVYFHIIGKDGSVTANTRSWLERNLSITPEQFRREKK